MFEKIKLPEIILESFFAHEGTKQKKSARLRQMKLINNFTVRSIFDLYF